MPQVYKVLGQANPTANISSPLYTVPSGRSAVISTITVANMDPTNINQYSINIRQLGASPNSAQYVAFNSSINPYDTIALTLGITLGNNDVVQVNSISSLVAFNAFGSEIY
jgi:hypothetical protein